MFEHFLLPVDGSPLSDSTFHKVITFAQETEARITVLHCSSHASPVGASVPVRDRIAQDAQHHADRYLKGIARKASAAGIKCETAYVSSDRLVKVIVATAEERGCDLILIAPHGRWGVQPLTIESIRESILSVSDISLVVV
ncbi:universal stress protein [Cupriavidus sp. CuC1]|uniref:universal stress protein n=1 Tax=Cupriavidus sp. CuC1 TaxID=3373131 RepID=UPI0037D875BC